MPESFRQQVRSKGPQLLQGLLRSKHEDPDTLVTITVAMLVWAPHVCARALSNGGRAGRHRATRPVSKGFTFITMDSLSPSTPQIEETSTTSTFVQTAVACVLHHKCHKLVLSETKSATVPTLPHHVAFRFTSSAAGSAETSPLISRD